MSEIEKILTKMESIDKLLVLIVQLFAPKPSTEGLNLGPTEKAVLELCNLQYSRTDMATKLGKSKDVIDSKLSSLRRKVLLQSVNLEGATYYLALPG